MTDTMTAPNTDEGYPGGRYPDRRRIGQFNWLQMAGFTVVPEDQLATKTYYGLHHTDTFVDGFFTGADNSLSVLVHDLQSGPDGAMRYGGFPIGALKATDDGIAPDPRAALTGDLRVSQELVDGRIVYTVTGDSGSEQIRFDGAALDWSDSNGKFQVSGALCGQGTQWHHAWRRPDDATGEMLYCHHGYDIAGTYLGEPVTGLVVIETMWGNENYLDTWFVHHRVGHWANFGVVYDDGTSEYGQVLCQEYGATGAVITDDTGRETVCTRNVRVEESESGDLHYEFGNGDAWEFTVDPRTVQRFGEPGEGTTLAFGSARRVGERRTVVRSTGSFFIARRLPEPVPFT